ncbi:hypothetical protein AAFF_G00321880 [Aldrovandia affinis]|uniref:Uncharacterized protein n=1 Tax=Aldrovandia affinis TaxID=143900 RepID=A0AAD7SM51_9TELE|nr:hypothetical protein AAFF_G00321880 [Aldrovandia affinis]
MSGFCSEAWLRCTCGAGRRLQTRRHAATGARLLSAGKLSSCSLLPCCHPPPPPSQTASCAAGGDVTPILTSDIRRMRFVTSRHNPPLSRPPAPWCCTVPLTQGHLTHQAGVPSLTRADNSATSLHHSP